MELISIRKYAERKGMSDTAIHKMFKDGRLSEAAIDRTNPARPKIRVEIADAEYIQNTNPNQERATKSGRTNSALLVAPVKMPATRSPTKAQVQKIVDQVEIDQDGQVDYGEDGIDLNEDPKDMHTARTQEAIWRAINIKLKTQELRRELVSLDEINVALGNMAVELRMDLTAIPDRIAADVLAAKDKFEAREIIDKAILDVLEKHSKLNVE